MRVAFALIERLKVGVNNGAIGRVARLAESRHGERRADVLVAREHLLDLRAQIARVRQRSALRSLNDEHDEALIIFRNERARYDLIDPVSRAENSHEEQQRRESPADDMPHRRAIHVGRPFDAAVESTEKRALRSLAMMTQEDCRKR